MKKPADRKTAGSRTRARRLAMQAIYQWLLNDASAADIEKQFREDPESQSANQEYLSELMRGVMKHYADLAEKLSPHLDRPLAEVDPVERAVLLIAVYEFDYVPSVPGKAIINEAIELTKTYGAEQAHKFVNGVLDKLARESRSTEMA